MSKSIIAMCPDGVKRRAAFTGSFYCEARPAQVRKNGVNVSGFLKMNADNNAVFYPFVFRSNQDKFKSLKSYYRQLEEFNDDDNYNYNIQGNQDEIINLLQYIPAGILRGVRDDITGTIVKAHEGEIVEAWITVSSKPYDINSYYCRVA